MFNLAQLFIVALVLAAALASISVWAPRKVWVRTSAIVIACLFLPLAYAGLADLLSKPKPVNLEWAHRNVPEATVLAAQLKENQGIYLWLKFDGADEPRSYVLPWDRNVAEQLQKGMREAEANKNGLRMKLPFQLSLDNRDPMFYALPQPALPPKDRDDSGPMQYQQPGVEA